jgi:hypothetical protein
MLFWIFVRASHRKFAGFQRKLVRLNAQDQSIRCGELDGIFLHSWARRRGRTWRWLKKNFLASGNLGATTRAVENRQVTAFLQGLHDHGWDDGRNIAIHFRWAEGFSERSTEIATEFVRLNVDVIVTWGTANIAAAKRATRSIPVVFAGAADPVGTGLVASLARPGGNLTGLSIQAIEHCGEVQGYLFSKPRPASEVEAMLRQLGPADQRAVA